jgi:hypothetical protein
MSVRLDNLENLVERHRNSFGSLKRHGAVLTLLSGSTKLPDNITGFADIVDEFVATGSMFLEFWSYVSLPATRAESRAT